MALKVLSSFVVACAATGEAPAASPSSDAELVNNLKGYVLPWMRNDEFVGAKHVGVADVAISMEKGLSLESSDPHHKLNEYREALRTFFSALPKNRFGYLEPDTARYALHRFFVHEHGWSFKGLEPNTDIEQQQRAAHSEAVKKEWVPEYLLGAFTTRVGHDGYTLEDLAALAATLEMLVRKEATGVLEEVYKGMEPPLGAETTSADMHRALKSYSVMFLGNGAWNLTKALTDEFFVKHAYWPATEKWLRQVERRELRDDDTVSFDEGARLAADINRRYHEYNDDECRKVKTTLMGAWSKGPTTGRIRLADFYKLGFEMDDFNFAEKPEFLRSMGALDDSNASSPMVIIPNYVLSMPNCLQATSLYAICCRNECEDRMTEIEKRVAAPTALAERLAEVVSSLMAPRELSSTLLARLQDIGARHGGSINLHGRLFAQWLHHVFPTECPYPHEAGKHEPVTSARWAAEGLEASEEERMAHIQEASQCTPEQAAAEYVAELPWSDVEELVSFEAVQRLDAAQAASDRHQATCLALLAFVAVLGTAVLAALLPLEKRQEFAVKARTQKRELAVSVLFFGALVTNIVNRLLLLAIVGSGLLVRLLSTSRRAAVKSVEGDKCMV